VNERRVTEKTRFLTAENAEIGKESGGKYILDFVLGVFLCDPCG
jgi:hypothetical protein